MTVFPPPARRAIAGAALSSIALLSAACGTSSAPSAGGTTTATATATASGATVSPTPGPGTSSSPAGPAGPAPCPTRSLGLKAGVSQGTAGSVYTVLDFTNISNVTCTLYRGLPLQLFGPTLLTGPGYGPAVLPGPGASVDAQPGSE
jgi:hypothetical protein